METETNVYGKSQCTFLRCGATPDMWNTECSASEILCINERHEVSWDSIYSWRIGRVLRSTSKTLGLLSLPRVVLFYTPKYIIIRSFKDTRSSKIIHSCMLHVKPNLNVYTSLRSKGPPFLLTLAYLIHMLGGTNSSPLSTTHHHHYHIKP